MTISKKSYFSICKSIDEKLMPLDTKDHKHVLLALVCTYISSVDEEPMVELKEFIESLLKMFKTCQDDNLFL